jgi:hypothetical protein
MKISKEVAQITMKMNEVGFVVTGCRLNDNAKKSVEFPAGSMYKLMHLSMQQLSMYEVSVIDPKRLDHGLLPSGGTDGGVPHPLGQI